MVPPPGSQKPEEGLLNHLLQKGGGCPGWPQHVHTIAGAWTVAAGRKGCTQQGRAQLMRFLTSTTTLLLLLLCSVLSCTAALLQAISHAGWIQADALLTSPVFGGAAGPVVLQFDDHAAACSLHA